MKFKIKIFSLFIITLLFFYHKTVNSFVHQNQEIMQNKIFLDEKETKKSQNEIISFNFQKEKENNYTFTDLCQNLNSFNIQKKRYKQVNDPNFLDDFLGTKIQLNNKSINFLQMFYKNSNVNNNSYQKTFPFIQFGIKNPYNKKFINVDLGNRYIYSNKFIYGYHIGYDKPISKKSIHPDMISFGSEFFYNNLLLKIDSTHNLEKSSNFLSENPQFSDKQYPKSILGVQAQSKLKFLSNLTGKIKIERFSYNLNFDNIINQHAKNIIDYCLTLGVDYRPIPIIGISINNTFYNTKKNNVFCQIILDYSFNQIFSKINKNQRPKELLLNNLFYWIQRNDYPCISYQDYCENFFKNIQSNEKIVGYPGEIKTFYFPKKSLAYYKKIILKENKTLINHGGFIKFKNNSYTIRFPEHPISEQDNVTMSYFVKNKIKNNYESYIIPIIVKQVTFPKTLPYIQDYDHLPSYVHEKNFNDSPQSRNSINSEESIKNIFYDADNFFDSNLITKYDEECSIDQKNKEEVKSSTTNTSDDKSFKNSIPIPPPMPNFLVKPQEKIFKQIEKKQFDGGDSHAIFDKEASTSSNANNMDTKDLSSIINNSNLNLSENKFNQTTSVNQQSSSDNNKSTCNFFDFLIESRKNKFSSINSQEHIERLENLIEQRKKERSTSKIHSILKTQFNRSQSSSSLEDFYLTDDSNDSFQ